MKSCPLCNSILIQYKSKSNKEHLEYCCPQEFHNMNNLSYFRDSVISHYYFWDGIETIYLNKYYLTIYSNSSNNSSMQIDINIINSGSEPIMIDSNNLNINCDEDTLSKKINLLLTFG